MKAFHLAILAALIASPVAAQEERVTLKDGAGKEAVERNCSVCHSLDYIPMNSKFLDRAKWDATIKKMSGPYGAGIDPEDAKEILNYLAANYAG
ncbi:MAG TPA: cytochrome c [Alphaproteobacteria bacterium]|nr:cytochrome c [Alphaproteobacteria bacterium]